MIDLGKKNLLGVGIDAVDYQAAVRRVVEAAEAGRRCTVTALAVHGVMTGALEPQHRYRLNRLDLVVPDGMPVRWGLNLLHRCALPDRVYGPNLMLKLCEAAAERGLPIFLFGCDESTLRLLERRLRERFPALRIAGCRASWFRRLSDAEGKELVAEIRGSGAKIAFVGIGCPRQEVWAYEFGDALAMPVIAVGAAFAFHAGSLPQAPGWMQNAGLEWLYRLGREPRRLWRRYAYLNPAYLSLLALQYAGVRRVDIAADPEPRERMLYG